MLTSVSNYEAIPGLFVFWQGNRVKKKGSANCGFAAYRTEATRFNLILPCYLASEVSFWPDSSSLKRFASCIILKIFSNCQTLTGIQ